MHRVAKRKIQAVLAARQQRDIIVKLCQTDNWEIGIFFAFVQPKLYLKKIKLEKKVDMKSG
jgi:hypothetical protein